MSVDEYQITPEMQAKLRDFAANQFIVAVARMVLDLHPSPDTARAKLFATIDELVDGYEIFNQPSEVVAAARDLMRSYLDPVLSQLTTRGF